MAFQSLALTQSQDQTLAGSDTASNLRAVYHLDAHPDRASLADDITQLPPHCEPLACRIIDSLVGTHFIVQPDACFEPKIISSFSLHVNTIN